MTITVIAAPTSAGMAYSPLCSTAGTRRRLLGVVFHLNAPRPPTAPPPT